MGGGGCRSREEVKEKEVRGGGRGQPSLEFCWDVKVRGKRGRGGSRAPSHTPLLPKNVRGRGLGGGVCQPRAHYAFLKCFQ